MANVAINGMGRIGRAAFKVIPDTPELDFVALNDLLAVENLAYLLRYDSVYGRYEKEVKAGSNSMAIDRQEYRMFSEKDPFARVNGCQSSSGAVLNA